jgi:type VI protein secretion system component VasF
MRAMNENTDTHSPEAAEAATQPTGNRRRIWLSRLVWTLFGAILAALALLAFLGYRQPGLLMDFVNLRYCS